MLTTDDRKKTVHEESGLRLYSEQTWEPGNVWLSNHMRNSTNSNFTIALTSYVVLLCRSYRCFVITPAGETRFRVTRKRGDVFGPLLRPQRHWNPWRGDEGGNKSSGNYFQSRCDVTLWQNSFASDGLPVAKRYFAIFLFLLKMTLDLWFVFEQDYLTRRHDWPGNVTPWRNIPVLSVVNSVSSWKLEKPLAKYRKINWNYLDVDKRMRIIVHTFYSSSLWPSWTYI